MIISEFQNHPQNYFSTYAYYYLLELVYFVHLAMADPVVKKLFLPKDLLLLWSCLTKIHGGATAIAYTANIYRMVISNFIGNPLST